MLLLVAFVASPITVSMETRLPVVYRDLFCHKSAVGQGSIIYPLSDSSPLGAGTTSRIAAEQSAVSQRKAKASFSERSGWLTLAQTQSRNGTIIVRFPPEHGILR